MFISFDQIKHDENVSAYIRRADENMRALGYTEHAFAHVTRTAQTAAELLSALGFPERTVELSQIAGYLHDIGNAVNRGDHAQSGALMAFTLLNNLSMPADEVAAIISAIGNHDEGTGVPVSEIAAALILADKSDVRRTRVRANTDIKTDIHDRVNFAVEQSSLLLNKQKTQVTLHLSVDTAVCPVMDYFEIFLGRMLLCRKAAEYLGLQFKLVINEVTLL